MRRLSEVGSGVTGTRATLARILADPRVGGIVVEHRDRRARFGVEHREAALAGHRPPRHRGEPR
jgi:putative resolvase